MIITTKIEKCTGCSACLSICPNKSIKMIANEKGFLYPQIDNSTCINCGLCNKVCPLNNKLLKKNTYNQKYYGIKIKDNKKRKESQSGGAFTAIAEIILEKKGIVYGVTLDKSEVYYQRINSINKLNNIKKSKYVQSEARNIFRQVKNDLINNNIVLFSGTPCYINGLNYFLEYSKVSTKNLLTVDIICHGVNSPKIFKEYYKSLKLNKNPQSFIFRNKINGWHNHIETFINDRNKLIASRKYTTLFYSNSFLRNCCYSCDYSSYDRVSDITIGDCWGIEKHQQNFDDNRGVSLLLINDEKGESLLNNIFLKCDYIFLEKDQTIQTNLIQSTKSNFNKKRLWLFYKFFGINITQIYIRIQKKIRSIFKKRKSR